MPTPSPIIAALRYTDAPAAIIFLCDVFGFEKHAVYTDPEDPSIVHHAQLTLGTGMIMLGSARTDAAQSLYGWKTAAEAGGITMSLYIVVDAIEAHFNHAQQAGAPIIKPLHDNDGYPGRGYETRDLEGNVWSFGSYDPWAE